MRIDLRSDTVTKPSVAMLEFMMQAEVGDDVFSEDPTVTKLEESVAKMFGQEAGLFCASGTMANQIAIKAQTRHLDEIITHKLSHIYYYETGGYASNSGVSVKLTNGINGQLFPKDILDNIQPDYDWLPDTSMVCIENTANKAGGTCYDLENMRELSEVCKVNDLKFHLDGARIWNAFEVKNYNAIQIGSLFDSISVCFSKGLGAPIGSMLLSDRATIKRARKIRKVMGGGMRQVGILAAACEFALANNRQKLQQDHQNAKAIGALLNEMNWVDKVYPIETNIILFDVRDDLEVASILDQLAEQDILMVQFGPKTIRCVTHLDFTHNQLVILSEKLQELKI